jgi:hypothetical protein
MIAGTEDVTFGACPTWEGSSRRHSQECLPRFAAGFALQAGNLSGLVRYLGGVAPLPPGEVAALPPGELAAASCFTAAAVLAVTEVAAEGEAAEARPAKAACAMHRTSAATAKAMYFTTRARAVRFLGIRESPRSAQRKQEITSRNSTSRLVNHDPDEPGAASKKTAR